MFLAKIPKIGEKSPFRLFFRSLDITLVTLRNSKCNNVSVHLKIPLLVVGGCSCQVNSDTFEAKVGRVWGLINEYITNTVIGCYWNTNTSVLKGTKLCINPILQTYRQCIKTGWHQLEMLF